jgi:O-antigen ligase
LVIAGSLALGGVSAAATLQATAGAVAGLFLVAGYASAFFGPVATVAGLNVKASQLVIPLVLIFLTRSSAWRWRDIPLAWAAVGLWGAFLFWTLMNGALGTLTNHYGNTAGVPLAHTMLLGLNLLHYGALALLLQQTRRPVVVAYTIVGAAAVMALWNGAVFVGGLRGWSFAQSYLVPSDEPILSVDLPQTGEDLLRLTAGVNTGTLLAGACVLALALVVGARGRVRLSAAAAAACSLFGVIVSIARGPVLALIIGLTVVVVAQRGRWMLVRVATLAVVVAVAAAVALTVATVLFEKQLFLVAAFKARLMMLFLPEGYLTGTAGSRLDLWSRLLADIAQNPFWGHGADSFQRHYESYSFSSESFPLEVLHSTGVWGVPAYLALQVWPLVRGWQALRWPLLPADHRPVLVGLLGACAGMLVASATNAVTGAPLYWMFFATLAAFATMSQNAADRVSGAGG